MQNIYIKELVIKCPFYSEYAKEKKEQEKKQCKTLQKGAAKKKKKSSSCPLKFHSLFDWKQMRPAPTNHSGAWMIPVPRKAHERPLAA